MYFFCAQPGCPVVYFAGADAFTTNEIRVAVFQKRPEDDDTPVCYCFGVTGQIRAEARATGASKAAEEIARRTRAGKCKCDTTNPQGSCCLGNVKALIRQARGGG